MTRRERLERRLERRQDWAGRASERSARAFEKSRAATAGIEFGQPILVGHHSEGKHRRALDRSWSALGKSVAEQKLSEHHESKARGLALQLEGSIFSDDPDAIERLEAKAAECDAQAAQCNAINRAWRKGGQAAVAAEFGEAIAAAGAKLCAQYSWLARKGPMNASHDRAEARRCRARIAQIQAQTARAARAAEAGGCVVTVEEGGRMVPLVVGTSAEQDVGTDAPPRGRTDEEREGWAVVTFAEKPDRSVLVALRAAGYAWGSGRWHGRRGKLPAEVVEILVEQAARTTEAAE